MEINYLEGINKKAQVEALTEELGRVTKDLVTCKSKIEYFTSKAETVEDEKAKEMAKQTALQITGTANELKAYREKILADLEAVK